MVGMLKAISLLLIGGSIGAFAVGAGNQTAIETGKAGRPADNMYGAALDAGPALSAEVSQYVLVGTHQALSAGTSAADAPAGERRGDRAPVRVAQAGGRLSDAGPPLPAMRPIPVRTGDADAATSTGQSAETRLAEAIQKELKRVGCYAGSIDGDWGPETRRAMRAFNDRVNATLPIEQPDYILLTLLQGHSAKACGAACPPGQEVASGGKCLPRSVIAEERRRQTAERAATSESARASVALSTGSVPEAAPRAVGDAAISAAPPAPSPRAERVERERQRSAAAEAYRKQAAAEAAARAETERLARFAPAENARTAAEARRRDEIAALAARAADRAAAAAAAHPAPLVRPPVARKSAAALPPPPLPVRPSETFRQQVIATRDALPVTVETALPGRNATPRRHRQRRKHEARYAGRFMPAPAYRVGRLPAIGARSIRFFAAAPRPEYRARYNPQGIFRELQHRMP